ncbi:MAG: aminotransferase class I/II-fold pyridoxal phosphate-dependent enzyme [Saprospiraceae bacterium]|nr:aminotransferase class I/II-fold pyridoxal phosphate-dependent enzyme [Saprospiraceae bacterium]
MDDILNFDSLCVKEVKDPRTTAPHVLPIYATSSFVFDSIDQGIKIFSGQEEGHGYSRYGNPTVDAVAEKIAMMETYGLNMDAEALMFSSGMSAISTLMLASMREGQKILTQGNLYGGTTELFTKVLQPLGIYTVMTDLQNLELVEQLIDEEGDIGMIYFETPANPTLACVDIEGICRIAAHYGIKTAIDNTFCTPYLQQPFAFGVDFIIHSTTKYLNGHGNSIAGALVGRDVEFMQEKVWKVMKLAGTNCNAWDAWLVNNGMKTLALRMDRHSSNAMAVANFLEAHDKVGKVNYAGLPSHPDHTVAKKQMRQFGGMLSFELKGGLQDGINFMNQIKMCTLAPTLGDVDTLILHPASSSHINIPEKMRLRNGITDGLIRMSIGIENVQDIIQDLNQALEIV